VTRRRVVEQLPTAAIALLAIAEILSARDAFAPLPRAAGVALAVVVALALRRRSPLTALVAVLALWFAGQTGDADHDPAVYAFFAALVAAAEVGLRREGRRQVVAAVVLAAVAEAVYSAVVRIDPFAGLLVVAAVLVGAVVRRQDSNARRLARERDEAAADERRRIARELHDSVAHTVSSMVLLAGGARRQLGPGSERASDALEQLERTGRDAVLELRALLDLLREDEAAEPLAPRPTLDRLGELQERARAAGLDVRVAIEGEPRELPRAVDLSAFRIVQEALTNVVRHAGPASAEVTVRYRPRVVELEVVDDGKGAASTNGGGSGGHGLVGMRERVRLFGGRLVAGPRPAGGFAIHAELPTDGGER
jgi:signal transduction histidine kinase